MADPVFSKAGGGCRARRPEDQGPIGANVCGERASHSPMNQEMGVVPPSQNIVELFFEIALFGAF